VPIRAFLRDGHFTPEDIAVLTDAFEQTLGALHLSDRNDPAVKLVAERIIKLARQGERDPATLRQVVLKSFKTDTGVSGL
jgi:hypothetical protein